MVLSDVNIREYIDLGMLCKSEIEDIQIQPASLDIRLGDSLQIFTQSSLYNYELKEISNFKRYTIHPRQFLLATTKEYIALPSDISAFVEGRSSIGRTGLFIQNAGWIDPGFEGEITLELYNASPNIIDIYAGQRIAQIVFCRMLTPAKNPYNGKYQGQTGATASKLHEDTDYEGA